LSINPQFVVKPAQNINSSIQCRHHREPQIQSRVLVSAVDHIAINCRQVSNDMQATLPSPKPSTTTPTQPSTLQNKISPAKSFSSVVQAEALVARLQSASPKQVHPPSRLARAPVLMIPKKQSRKRPKMQDDPYQKC
jgi:hypothetical protein